MHRIRTETLFLELVTGHDIVCYNVHIMCSCEAWSTWMAHWMQRLTLSFEASISVDPKSGKLKKIWALRKTGMTGESLWENAKLSKTFVDSESYESCLLWDFFRRWQSATLAILWTSTAEGWETKRTWQIWLPWAAAATTLAAPRPDLVFPHHENEIAQSPYLRAVWAFENVMNVLNGCRMCVGSDRGCSFEAKQPMTSHMSKRGCIVRLCWEPQRMWTAAPGCTKTLLGLFTLAHLLYR